MIYKRPDTLEDALCLINTEPGVKILAGGTDIIPGIRQNSSRFRNIKTLCDITHLPETNFISKNDSCINIGSAVTFTQISESKLIKDHYPLLVKAASGVGSVQIRNRATIAGNFVNNAPCADSVPPLLVYDAAIKIRSLNGTREMLLQDFLQAPYKTRLTGNELVTEISLPLISNEYKGDFYKLGRRRGVSISRISFAVLTSVNEGILDDIRIASGAVTPIGMRLKQLEDYAKCKKLTKEFIKELAVEFGKQIINIAGVRWSAPYKIPTAQQMFYQVLLQLCC